MGQETYPVVIIGAGPAGLAAAMQLSRQGYQPLVLERNRVGGLLWNANLVENYPGFCQGISGPELVSLFQEQAKHLGVSIAFEEVQRTEFDGDLFHIETDKRKLAARVLIAATGTKPKKLADELGGSRLPERVYSEVYPLLNCSGHTVIIIGGGDAAFDYALNLATGNQVVILNRGEEIKALPLLVERGLDHPAITYHDRAEVKSLTSDRDGKLNLEVSMNGRVERIEGDYLIAAIGREPDTDFAAPSIMKALDQLEKSRRLFLIGDLKNGLFRQTAIAVGDGIRAAMEIDQYLSKGSL